MERFVLTISACLPVSNILYITYLFTIQDNWSLSFKKRCSCCLKSERLSCYIIFFHNFVSLNSHVMKLHKLLFFSLCLLCLCSCKDHRSPHILSVVDSLTYVHPDSAINLLNSLKAQMNNEPESTQMYYRLLQIKANDKAYIPHTSDSIILPIVEYYEKKRGEGHLMEAYYYAGRVYRDLQDAPHALDYFQRAAQISSGSTDYRLISKIYAQIATLFDYQDIYDESLKMFKNYKSTEDDLLKIYNYLESRNFSKNVLYKSLSNTNLQKKKRNLNFAYNRVLCTANYSHLFILPDGQVTICEQLYWNPKFVVGDININSLKDIWNSEKALSLYNIDQAIINKESPCSKCKAFDICRHESGGVCWKNVISAYGEENWDYPDPNCINAPDVFNNIYI